MEKVLRLFFLRQKMEWEKCGKRKTTAKEKTRLVKRKITWEKKKRKIT